MEVYFSMLIFILFFSFFKSKKLQIATIFTMFLLISLLRYTYLGTDTQNYINFFKRISTNSFKDVFFNKFSIERGFVILNKILSLISNSERYFIVVTSMILLILITRFIIINSNIPWLSFYLFLSLGYFTSSFNILRQIIAMFILLNTLDYIKNREIKKFLFFYVIAISIHTTALFFIIVYIIYPFKINLKYCFFSFLSACFLYLFSNKILGLAFSFSNKYQMRYAENLRGGNGKGMLIMIFGVFFIGLFLEKLKIKKDKNYIFYHLLNIAVILQVISLKFSLFVRVVSYFSIGLIIFIPNILYKIKNKKLNFIASIIICMVTSYYLYMILYKDLGGVVPYKFYFSN